MPDNRSEATVSDQSVLSGSIQPVLQKYVFMDRLRDLDGENSTEESVKALLAFSIKQNVEGA